MSFIKPLKVRVMQASRRKKIERFFSLCEPDASVLDVGVANEVRPGSPMRNYFTRNFRLSPEQYTGLAVEDMSGMCGVYPGKKFVQYGGSSFPFADRRFDWVFSNAVIEHVGARDAQLEFLNEMLRVGRRVFFTTPNRFFPLEAHTNALFVHWNEERFRRWREKREGKDQSILELLGRRALASILDESRATEYTIEKNRAIGWTMTFSVICRGA